MRCTGGSGWRRDMLVGMAWGEMVELKARISKDNPYTQCPKYWQGCFECKYYIGFGYVKFCRAYNLRKFGKEIVEDVIETTPEEEESLVREWVRKQQRQERPRKQTSRRR